MKNYELFIGIDISKKTIDVSLAFDGDKKKMIHRQFDNVEKDFKKMLTWVKKNSKGQYSRSDWLFCMEHTGIYTLALCCFLQNEKLDYTLESGLQIKKSLGIRRGKDDKSDSKDIAAYVFHFHKRLRINNLPSVKLMQLKNLLSLRKRCVKQRTMVKNSSKEFNQLMPEKYKVDIMSSSDEELMEVLDKKISLIEKTILSIIKEDPELKRLYELVVSVKGIGPVIGASMLVYTNGFKAFDNARKFACYIAIAPFGQSSGTSLYINPKVGKLGLKGMKALFSSACMTTIRHDKQIKAYYNRKMAEGKKKSTVYNAIKNKLVARIFAVVKRGTPFVDLAY